jgi:hypothetical protein
MTVRLAMGPSLTVYFADKELNLGHWYGIMVELRLNITESKILHSYNNNRSTKCKVFISYSALLKNLRSCLFFALLMYNSYHPPHQSPAPFFYQLTHTHTQPYADKVGVYLCYHTLRLLLHEGGGLVRA